ncbi:hypothetical protein I545_5310 [Mycobacterium kansasii 662]|uniref:Uncharacterized protein n=2 Tax=Mycobacterium kansasii TaxID=1768 RepID=A0A1V3WKK9_MYCKA|nr:hypothetical protein I545_5310 [Mycobacterium kansasii 662]KEP44087.1 hypothetical protein MKSMC1_08430 [Mycobacterium kansasii]OOK66966.1 hypothetical protein BZL29_7217 [Mycobacterium kansasii]
MWRETTGPRRRTHAGIAWLSLWHNTIGGSRQHALPPPTGSEIAGPTKPTTSFRSPRAQ